MIDLEFFSEKHQLKGKPNKSISDAIDDFFKIGTGGSNTEDAVMEGFKVRSSACLFEIRANHLLA